MKKKYIGGYILLAVVVILCFLVMFLGKDIGKLPREKDTEFAKGSGIVLEELTGGEELSRLQTESLYKLCKVWGYAKYRHPDVINGNLNWDSELFRVLPAVVSAESGRAANDVIGRWLAKFPFEIPKTDETTDFWLALQEERGYSQGDSEWIEDRGFLGGQICEILERLSQVYIADRKNSYAAFDGIRVDFSGEQNLVFAPEDDGVKLLSLFRFWNIYEYFSPNLSITVKDWDEVLLEAIPKVAAAGSREEYVLAIAETAARTGDAHLTVGDSDMVVWNLYGKRYLPCRFLSAENRIVAVDTGNQEGGLQDGDVILEIDATTVENRIELLSRYSALPEPDKLVNQLQYSLLKAEGEEARVKVLRGEEEITVTVQTLEMLPPRQNPHENGFLTEDIGYIDPGALEKGELEKRMEEFADTKGIIVDLRQYPSQVITYLLAEYVKPQPTVFAKMTMANQALPGSFCYFPEEGRQSGFGFTKEGKGDGSYGGRVVLLMNEESQSQAEFAIMSLRTAPKAVVVGSSSVGADGDISVLSLPGGIQMAISGLGVYTPEGGQTQRVGLTPDIECYPTIAGIREGRDELLEKAMEIIKQN